MSTVTDAETPVRIGVVLGSSRPGRLGDRVGRFVMARSEEVAAAAGAEFALLDLGGYGLPFFDEELPPWNNPGRQPAPNVTRWLADMAWADGYLFLVPEYNYAVPAVVKNALDLLGHEADGKPAAIVSYSDTQMGGTIAGHELRLVINKLGMLPLPRSLPLAHADQLLDADGALVADTDYARKVATFVPWSLGELVRYAAALRPLRDQASLV
jgi:chromate reductase, NAD(P)H dehydrogenase (quinone)